MKIFHIIVYNISILFLNIQKCLLDVSSLRSQMSLLKHFKVLP